MSARQTNEDKEPNRGFGNRIEQSKIDNLIQAGTIEHLYLSGGSRTRIDGGRRGALRSRYGGRGAPLDLLKLRLWLDRIIEEYRARGSAEPGGHDNRTLERVERLASQIDDPPTQAWSNRSDNSRSEVERLVVLGIAGYLERAAQSPPKRVPGQVLLDLLVFGMWPVVTAKRLPENWRESLSLISSPRITDLVERARADHAARRKDAADRFAQGVASQDFSTAMLMLCEALSDPSGAGAALASMAVAAGLRPARFTWPRDILKWMLGTAMGAGAIGAGFYFRGDIEGFVDTLTDDMPLLGHRNAHWLPGLCDGGVDATGEPGEADGHVDIGEGGDGGTGGE